MKKLLALLMALVVMLSVSLCVAEEVEAITVDGVTSVYYDNTLRFDLKVPEGYQLTVTRDGIILMMCLDGGEGFYDIDVLVCPDDVYSDYATFNDMPEDELEAEIAKLSEGYNAPETSILTTGEGTKVIKIDETGAEMDYVEIIGLYNGYVIDVYIPSDDGDAVTDEDIANAMAFCTDWKFITLE